jgi:hypothetical protein
VTEQEWLASTNPKPMLPFLLGADYLRVQDVESFPGCKGSDRKLRLFACACYFRICHLLPDAVALAAVQVAERFADGLATLADLEEATARLRGPLDALEGPWRAARGDQWEALLPTHAALSLASQAVRTEAPKAAYYASSNASWTIAAIRHPGVAMSDSDFSRSEVAEQRIQTRLLRCIFGLLPFRPVTIEPAWQTSAVRRLAEVIHEEKAFDRMPILADALEDAGCSDASILGHLRRPDEHVRGCWPVDLALGKE